MEHVLLQDPKVRQIIETKINQKDFILRQDRMAISAVLIQAVIESLGTRYHFLNENK